MPASSEITTVPPPTVSVPSDVRWGRPAKLLEKDDELKARARRLRVVEPPTALGREPTGRDPTDPALSPSRILASVGPQLFYLPLYLEED
jgi:hypothetical protein